MYLENYIITNEPSFYQFVKQTYSVTLRMSLSTRELPTYFSPGGKPLANDGTGYPHLSQDVQKSEQVFSKHKTLFYS